ncbi:MAG: HAMP domain-containing sensor histidine kinase [Actinomycetota bacterium]|nr:HAMP domain-containing sensor histidine kinase [Actinomycetota bacterium]
MKLGLRTRVAVALALVSLAVAGVVAIGTYGFASWYLLDQRQTAALTRAVLDARAVNSALDGGTSPTAALELVPSVGTSQPMINTSDGWHTASIGLPPSVFPANFLSLAADQGAQQRIEVGGDPYYVVGVPLTSGTYVEVFPLRELQQNLNLAATGLIMMSLVAATLGAVVGATTASRILVPVRRLGSGAQRIAGGELGARIDLNGDADLDPIADSFNAMAEAVQQRIARERRFTANVSHELRSPVTSIVGTAEVLERHADHLTAEDSPMIAVLGEQARKLSQTLRDLMEISRLDGGDPLVLEYRDLTSLCRDVAFSRGVDPDLVSGGPSWTFTDGRRVERIVGNLLENAQRHAGGPTEILVVTSGPMVDICVGDAGPGVAPADRARLFEPFARGEGSESTTGSGLGLAIALEQAKALGGDISLHESGDGGARFIVHLPLRLELP